MKTKKRLLAVCIGGILILCLAGLLLTTGMMRRTKVNDNILPQEPETDDTQPDELSEKTCNFNAQYIRTDGFQEDTIYPEVKIIRSVDELKAYRKAHMELHDLEHRHAPDAEPTISFIAACDKYDRAYFENQILVMVLLEDNGAYQHEVKRVNLTGETMTVEIDSIIPESGPCDCMAMWHILIEPEAETDVKSESDVTVVWNGTNMSDRPTVAQYQKGYANITLNLPDGWKYQIEDDDENANFYIEIRPIGQPPEHQGKIRVCYSNDYFGVCGTGLEQEKIKLGKYEAYKGTYDNKKVWDFINLIDVPGDYYILNYGDEAWWDTYGDQAMQSLDTLIVGDGILTEAQATKTAETQASVEYNETDARFDAVTGNWTVRFYKEENTVDADQTVIIDANGNILPQISYRASTDHPKDSENFYFSLNWGCYGISSYNSSTGKLIKTTDATHPEDYITTYQLTEEQKKQIYQLIEDLDITSYPDTYNPHGEGVSIPPMTLILSVQTDTIQKTIRAENTVISYETDNPKGQAFLDVCKAIEDILTATDEWSALPEYEFIYE